MDGVSMADDDLLLEARRLFDLASEVENENRQDALDDLKFARLGEQWPDDVIQARKLEGRPCLTINRLPAFIRQVVNDARQNKPAIKVHPADDSADPETAEIFNGLIRNIEVTSDADVAFDTALESAVTGGFGYFRINTRYSDEDTFDQDLVIERIANPFSVFGDPYSTAADSSDWDNAFIVETMSKDAFERKYKGSEPVDWSADGYVGLGAPWIDDDQVMVCEWWTREEVKKQIVQLSNGEVVDLKVFEANADQFAELGLEVVGEPREVRGHKVIQRCMTGGEILTTIDWPGKYIPIIPVYGDEVNVEGKRFFRSMVRDAKDPQRMFNYWRTASTELVALAPKTPFIGPKGAFVTDFEKWATANTSSHAYIEYDGGTPPQRQPFAGVPAGALQEALNASDDIKAIVGLHDASLGARSNETSGVAIMARQREGDVSTFHFIDNLSRAIRHAGRVLIDLIPKVYSTDRVIRTLGPQEEPETVRIGQEAGEMQNQRGEIIKIYSLNAGKYDLTVQTGPSFTTRRQEAAAQMQELFRAYPPAAEVIGDLFVKAQDWPMADEIAERLKGLFDQRFGGQQQGAPQQPQQPPVDPAQMAKFQLDQQKLQMDASLEQEKLRIDGFNAETQRMKTVHDIQQPTRLPRMPAQQGF
jgi:hypothetical protein